MQDFFFKSLFSPKARQKSSCHRALRAAGTETAAVRLQKQSGPSPFCSHLRPDMPTVKISVHTPRVRQGKRLTACTGATHTCTPRHTNTHRADHHPLLSVTTSVEKNKTTATVSLRATWLANQSRCVCACVCVWIYWDTVESASPSPQLCAVSQRDPCIQRVFVSKQSIKETGSGSVSRDQIDAGSHKAGLCSARLSGTHTYVRERKKTGQNMLKFNKIVFPRYFLEKKWFVFGLGFHSFCGCLGF